MRRNKMNRATIYPKDKLFKNLKDMCKEESRSLNNLVLLILEEYFENKRIEELAK